MTTAAQQHRIQNAERQLAAVRAEMAQHAPNTMAHRHAKDRADTLERELARYRAGQLTAKD